MIGFLNDRTHSLTAGFGFIALAYVAAGSLVLSLKIRYPGDGKAKGQVAGELSATQKTRYRTNGFRSEAHGALDATYQALGAPLG